MWLISTSTSTTSPRSVAGSVLDAWDMASVERVPLLLLVLLLQLKLPLPRKPPPPLKLPLLLMLLQVLALPLVLVLEQGLE
jgi:hypothetical protein